MIEPEKIEIAGAPTEEERYAVRGAACLAARRYRFPPATFDEYWEALTVAAGMAAEMARGRISPDVRDCILALGRLISAPEAAKKCLGKRGEKVPRPARRKSDRIR